MFAAQSNLGNGERSSKVRLAACFYLLSSPMTSSTRITSPLRDAPRVMLFGLLHRLLGRSVCSSEVVLGSSSYSASLLVFIGKRLTPLLEFVNTPTTGYSRYYGRVHSTLLSGFQLIYLLSLLGLG